MLPHRVWISSGPYEGRRKGGWVDRGAGFTGRINVIKYQSISRSGGEAWQIQLACGLISTSGEDNPLLLAAYFCFKSVIFDYGNTWSCLKEKQHQKPHFHSFKIPQSPPTPLHSVSLGMSTEYFPRLWRHFPLASLESVVGRCKTLLRRVVWHGSVSPPLKSLPGCCGI